MHDLISIGDATIDHFFFFHDASVHCSVNKAECFLTLHYADKIAVDQYYHSVAGNAANNAVGSARLGLKTAFYTVLGDDSGGREIRHKMAKEGVDTRYIVMKKGESTNISSVLVFKGERTILVYHVPRRYHAPRLEQSRWVYLTSAGPADRVGSLHQQVLAYLKKNPSTKLGFNPGTHQLKLGRAKLLPLLRRTDALFLNREESMLVLGIKRKLPMIDLAKKLVSVGPRIAVVTDADTGSYVWDGKAGYHLRSHPAKPIERTGAGDSFATGFIAALNYKKSIPEAMVWGTLNAGSVILKVGPQAGLLTSREMKRHQKKYAKVLRPKKV